MPSLVENYRALLLDPDPLRRRVAQQQLTRLGRASCPPSTTAPDRRPSRWAHAPLARLFEEQGNRIYARGGRLESGHEPMHGSKSGRCVLIDAARGRWYCRSCRQSGDAATFIMRWRGWPYRRTAAWLVTHYGLPPDRAPRHRRRPPLVVR